MILRMSELADITGASFHEVNRAANLLGVETGSKGIFVHEDEPPVIELLTEMLPDRLLTEDAVTSIKKLLGLR